MKVLLTSTSFQDCSGSHQSLLDDQGWEVSYMRGPLAKKEIISEIEKYDALICGDDELDQEVLAAGKKGRLKFISKYGVGLDKVDLDAAKELGIPVRNCRGVNEVAVAEHVLAMLFAHMKNVIVSHKNTCEGQWVRPVGRELFGKSIGIIGLGAIGKELAKRTVALGLETIAYDPQIDLDFVREFGIKTVNCIKEAFQTCEIVSLHAPLTNSTRGMITREVLQANLQGNLTLVNTARAGLVLEEDIVWALEKEVLSAYLTDVLSIEPMVEECLLRNKNGVLITPHVGSRTKETIQKQGSMAVNNLKELIG